MIRLAGEFIQQYILLPIN